MSEVFLWSSNLSASLAIWTGRKERTVLWFYVLFSFLFDINGYILKNLKVERLWASNLFILIEFILITVYFIRNVFPRKNAIVWHVCLTVISAYFIIDTCRLSVWKPKYLGAALLYALYIFYCLYGLYRVISEIEFVVIEKNPLFIFCIAILLYASGSFIIFLFESKIWPTEEAFGNKVWMYVRNPVNIIKNLLMAYGFRIIKDRR